MPKLTDLLPVMVLWLDTQEDCTWHNAEDIGGSVGPLVITLGLFVEKQEKFLILTNTVTLKKPKRKWLLEQGSELKIPNGMIECTVELVAKMDHLKLYEQLLKSLERTE